MSNTDDQATLQDTALNEKNAGAATNVTVDHSQVESVLTQALFDPNKLGILDEVSVAITIEIGRSQIKIRDLLNLTKDSIIDLDKLAGEPVDVYANGKLISKGNIITVNGKYCVRLISIPKTKV
jgi:flagellar motor switch protein FliN